MTGTPRLAGNHIVVSSVELDKLCRGLSRTFRDFGNGRDPNVMQARYMLALTHIAEFVRDTGMGNDIANDLCRLALAIGDLNIGIVHPVLQKKNYENRAPDRSDVWHVRAMLVTAYEYLRAGGMTKTAALAVIQQEGAGLGNVLATVRGESASLYSSLIEWRRTLKNGMAPRGIGPLHYQQCMASLQLHKDLNATNPADLIDLQAVGMWQLRAAVNAAKAIVG
jgi:hypothetical protein